MTQKHIRQSCLTQEVLLLGASAAALPFSSVPLRAEKFAMGHPVGILGGVKVLIYLYLSFFMSTIVSL